MLGIALPGIAWPAIQAAVGVVEHAEEPGLAIRAGRGGRGGAQRADIGLLDEIIGVARMAGEIASEGVQTIGLGQRVAIQRRLPQR